MYLSIGGDMAVRASSIVGIFDLDNTTCSARTRAFLRRAERDGQTVAAGDELPKSFILTAEFGMERVYFSQFGPATLERRVNESAQGENSQKNE